MKQTIAVIFGGRSTEHDVSIITALSTVIKPLELTDKYTVLPIYITKDGDWYMDDKLKDISLYTGGAIQDTLARLKRAQILFEDGLQIVSGGLKPKKTKIDIVFPAMHGTYGEDGSLMGLLRMANVPFVGCDMAGSAAAMDKITSKLLATANGIEITSMQFFTKSQFTESPEKILEILESELSFPVFVKPAHMGSSIGLTKVSEKAELHDALEVAFHYDTDVLVEEAVDNLIEVTLPIMGNDKPICALLEQPVLPEDGVFDFDTKYLKGGKKGKGGAKAGNDSAQGYSILPADIPKDLYEAAVQVGYDSYRAIGCSGYARIDMLIDSKTKKIYFNEINPLPGSLYAHNWKKAGVSNVELVEKLIGYAHERHEQANDLSVAFDTSFLSQF